MTLIWPRANPLQGERPQTRWLGEPPAVGNLAPSEVPLEGAKYLGRDRDGRMVIRARAIVVTVAVTAAAPPLYDLMRGRFLDHGWTAYLPGAVAALITVVWGLIAEFRKHQQ